MLSILDAKLLEVLMSGQYDIKPQEITPEELAYVMESEARPENF